MNSVKIVTLGCSKNEVDSSCMMSILDKNRYSVENDPQKADIIIVNTCGFIDAAKEESIDTILQMAKYKETGSCKKMILSGCLAQRYPEELLKEIPEADGIIGTGNISQINDILDRSIDGERVIKVDNINSPYLQGIKKEKVNITEYVKISEGCNNNCSYCIIPKLRGKNRSRRIEDIYEEVSYLAKNGAREIILIAQNTTDYGIDLYGRYSLSKLIKEISKINDIKWIRVLYLYPDHFTDELISEFINNDKLVKYVDIPLQHYSDHVLKLMDRHTDKEHIKNLIEKLRKIKGLVIRTTFIVGFPGESEEDFNILREFINTYKFDKLGVFTYSREESTKANNLNEQIDEDVKEYRRDIIMEDQLKISERLLEDKIGQVLQVLIEEKIEDNLYAGRSYLDSPDIDGVIYVNSNKNLSINSFINVKVTSSMEYDLIGDAV
ncbi:MAG: 30S ribosomal protein S12 methylthiotransferase RimO [Peptoniphilus lacrimalis]|uniref:30S ribosomal protein S12 methylthiotransferase RimO n=1 Tax=Peptoniphilus lacrimalis TaxID=33031 RepID=UPI002549F1C5|nr:30S ribosomal protein S12 methylthiotransferase RimO [Peptoniphilus lacrimalis]MDK8282158.1 30S ribosomal protein S12 methylthiotransferase RimO [Peptoniphilus lacrimalis]